MILDIIAALLITYGFYRGFSKGLIDTVVDVLSILVGLVCAFTFSPMLIEFLQDKINLGGGIGFIVGFLIVFFAVMLILRFIADKMEDLLKATKINFINQIAGGLLLGFVVAFLVGVLLGMLTNLNVLNTEFASTSTLYEYLITVSEEGGWLIDKFKNLFADFWAKFMETVDTAKNSMESKQL